MHFALHAGTVIDPVAGALPDHIIEVQDGTITAVSPAADWSGSGVPVHDASTLVVVPGFVDCHDHLTISGGDEVEQALRPFARQAVTATVVARTIIEAGITTVRTLGDADAMDIKAKRAIDEGKIPGPRIIPAVAPITRTGGHAHFMGTVADGEDAVRRAVRQHLATGARWIKVMASGGNSTPGSDPMVQEFTDAELLAVGDEAARAGLDVTGHLHGGPAVDTAIKAGFRSIEHGAFLTTEQLDQIAEAGMWLVSTVGIGRAVADDPTAPEFYRVKAQRALARRIQMLREARARGVKVAIGCDGNHGKVAVEADALLEAGFAPLEVLRSLTLEGARLCRTDDVQGTVEVGKHADLVVLGSDPLASASSYSDVRAVYRYGQLYPVSQPRSSERLSDQHLTREPVVNGPATAGA
ncbi:metal-dependent hydrolase family protein [Georgenia faecalis]|uniref:Amidohydrolase family protein n=1 Tax=Georgenia faecalis TaxID=2483799 RepID=A0ABV9D9F3_9MICO|nr:amidohydrolase family protein [Georgenia faecalis]